MEGPSSSGPPPTLHPNIIPPTPPEPNIIPPIPTEVDSNEIYWDPFDRKKIGSYPPNQRDSIRRKYMTKGPSQPKMDEVYVNPRNRRQHQQMSNHDYYEFFCFNTVLDMQIVEFGDRFNEDSSQLLICMTGLNPRESFCDFDPSKLQKLIDFYPQDFSYNDRMNILHELSVYPSHMQQDERFANLKSISELAKKLVDTKMHLFFPLIYRLVKLTLVLPVATATVERCFSAMKLVKSDLRNRIADGFLNDCLICAVEREAFSKVTNECIIKRYVLVPRRDQV